MADAFDRFIDPLLAREGGHVDHPDDRGGETAWGITEQVARAQGFAGPMAALSRGAAKAIYRRTYWEAPGLQAVARLSDAVAGELLDTGVNMGPGAAARFLQRALNVLNGKGRHWPDVAVDGRIGPASLAALAALLKRRGPAGEAVLLKALNGLQAARYIELCEAREPNESFAFGWLAERVGMAG